MDDDDKTRISVSTVGTNPSSPSDNNALPNGTKLFEFEILNVLGCGGFGIVYFANDTSLNRHVALKEYMPTVFARRTAGETVSLISPQHADTFELGMKSFINEAQLLAQFNHHSLVKVHRFWEANGTAYMVMPFYIGNTLSVALRQMESAPDEEWLREFLSHILHALEVMHAKQCFHRDIAPDNILIVEGSNWPVLLDFGAARHVIEGKEQALTVILKPNYAPIEQYGNDDTMAQGPWTDIYSLASVVHLAIMGKVPQLAMQRMLNDRYVPLTVAAEQLMPGRYSKAFLAAIDKALSLKPQDRPQSVTQFRELLGMEPIRTGPRITELDRREPKTLSKSSTIQRNIIIASIFCGVVVLFFLAWVLMDNPRSVKATKDESLEKQESSQPSNVTTNNQLGIPSVNSVDQHNSRAVEAVARTFDPIREFESVVKNAD